MSSRLRCAVHWWKHKFTSECMNSVYDQAFGSKTPTHATIMQMDRKLRAFPVPPLLQIAGFGSSESRMAHYDSVPLILQRHVVLAIRESSESPRVSPADSRVWMADFASRSAVHAPWLLRARHQRPSAGPTREPVWRLLHCGLPQRRLARRARAQHPLAAQRAHGAHVVPLDASLLVLGKYTAQFVLPPHVRHTVLFFGS